MYCHAPSWYCSEGMEIRDTWCPPWPPGSIQTICITELITGGTKCRKKVQEVSGHQGVFSCKCGATDIPTQETALRYMVRICLADCTDYEWAVMFEAESLFGKTAQELCDIREKSEEDFMQLVQSLQFTERLWTVAAKVETYQGENRVNTGIVLINSTVCGCREGELIN